jgi:hypothetical protein
VAIPEVSERAAVRQSRRDYEIAKQQQRAAAGKLT